MKKINILFLAIFISAIFFGCEDRKDLTAPEPLKPVQGSVDFTRLVAIGNSLTAGMQDNSVYQSAQMYSFPAQIAKLVNTEFVQPIISDPGMPGRLELKSLAPEIVPNSAMGAPLNSTYPNSFNNLGVPGAFLYDVLNAKDQNSCFQKIFGGVSNPMFDVVLRGKGTMYQQAKALNPTFVLLWIGNNDILGYAVYGADTLKAKPTPVANFTALYNQMADSIAKLGAKVAIANIVDVTTIPYFNTVGPSLYYTKSTPQIVGINKAGQVVPMSTLTNYITLAAQAMLAQGYGASPTKPLPSEYILDSLEAIDVRNITAQYNNVISTVAAAKGFAVFDINTIFKNYISPTGKTGIMHNGILFNTGFISGGLFSLDGVHPTSRGYSLVANEFIKAINSKFGSSVPLINVSLVPGSLNFKQ